MAHDPKLLDEIEAVHPQSWTGTVFRYTAGSRPPERENTHGARWNPSGVGAVYTTLDRETALAELTHHLNMLSPRPTRLDFTLYTLHVSVELTLDLRATALLERLGVNSEALGGLDMSACQAVGHAVSWLGRGGILVPSARRTGGDNLVIFAHNQPSDFVVEIESQEPLVL